jgi:hypothetical protein
MRIEFHARSPERFALRFESHRDFKTLVPPLLFDASYTEALADFVLLCRESSAGAEQARGILEKNWPPPELVEG